MTELEKLNILVIKEYFGISTKEAINIYMKGLDSLGRDDRDIICSLTMEIYERRHNNG